MPYSPKMGMTLDEIDTPALIVDLDALEANLNTMQSFFKGKKVQLRPHIKTHKSPEIARRQIAAGAVGITCAKVSEAEVMASAGISNILIANQMVGPIKIMRTVELASRCNLIVAVDDINNARQLSAACRAANVTLGLLIEVDIGMGRCGVTAGQPALTLAQQINDLPGLSFRGFQAYEGHLVLTADPAERRAKVQKAFAPLKETYDLFLQHGLTPQIISGGGTGTYAITSEIEPVNEIQAGSYVFMDSTYQPICPEFTPSLFVLSSVVSRSNANQLVLDAGLKAMTKEFGLPNLADVPSSKMRYLSEEHAVMDLADGNNVHLKPGDRARFIPSHCCTTVNLHTMLHVIRGNVLVDLWPIAARGCVQ